MGSSPAFRPSEKLINRKLETAQAGIADFQRRFLHLLGNLGRA
jgi:hypothetical protein